MRHAPGIWRRLRSEMAPACQRQWEQAIADGWRMDAPSAYCHRCGGSVGLGEVTVEGCAACRGTRPQWDRLIRLGSYASPLDQWILAMKFRGAWSWGHWFGRQLFQATRQIVDSADRVAVCPVPMHWLRRWRRGYNQSQLMAGGLAEGANWTLAPVLGRTRHTRPQTTVPPAQRQANVKGAFAVKKVDLRGWHVWLVDDVKTTGATAQGCARLLREAGAEWVGLAVAAVSEPLKRQ